MPRATTLARRSVKSCSIVAVARRCRVFSASPSAIGASGAGFENAAGPKAGGGVCEFECCGMLSEERKETTDINQTMINRRFNIEKTSKDPVKHQT